MDPGTLENANPTILTQAQLPSRKQRKLGASSRGPHQKYDEIISLKRSAAPWRSSSLSSEEDELDDGDDGEDYTEEPIDEQEIYGELMTIPHIFLMLHE